ncbi:P-loop containing nucleoside triphosphate hydrolase protein [Xylariaceae sp. FL0594]|nr:P-loop containing nucleoside triphosphate hydrolase protein [Xylariaceae sp. FL0594]
MDVQAQLGGVFSPLTANGTIPMGNSSSGPGSHGLYIVETLLPLVGLRGLAPVYQIVESALGWDPTYLLAVLGCVWAFNMLLQQIPDFFDYLLMKYMMSTVHITNGDDIYYHLMAWLSKQPELVNSRFIMAETVRRRIWEDEDISTIGRDSSGMYLNFSRQEARTRPKYVPAPGQHTFRWNGWYFRLQRRKASILSDEYGLAAFKDQDDLIISCISRSPGPIKELLAHAKEQYYSQHEARTTVKRPSPEKMRQSHHNWQVVASRPVRDMRTVILDQEQKLQVLADMNEYLHPATPRWYANRGIPLRRGYLFHGPPGTGKTSLSFSLAGVFGLDIYVISLLEPSLTEEDLGNLFTSLPRRCIILLEDIDTAGLRRTGEEKPADGEEPAVADADSGAAKESGENVAKKSASDSGALDIKELAKALKQETEDQKKGISLSGLLNAIDGVSSHEGRILIMTTNRPESLDSALIRPGRVDLQVQFTNATKEQASELFLRIYDGDEERPRMEGPTLSTSSTERSTPVHEKASSDQVSNGNAKSVPGTGSGADLDISASELPDYARRFGEMIPDGQFSPAEIQGYLLKRKKTPRKALEEAESWIAALRQQKAKKSKIVQVQ